MFTGTYVITSYAVIIFEETGTSIDPFTASIVLSVIQIFGCLCSTQFADRLGRKVSLLLSLIGSAIGSLSLAFYLQCVDYGFDFTDYAWLPVLSLSFIIFIASSGIFPLLSVCTVENLPTKVCKTHESRSFCFSLTIKKACEREMERAYLDVFCYRFNHLFVFCIV